MTNDLRANTQKEMAMTTDLSKPTAVEVLKAYEQWERGVVASRQAYEDGHAPLLMMTEEQWDRLLEIQAMRNQVLRAAAEEVSP